MRAGLLLAALSLAASVTAGCAGRAPVNAPGERADLLGQSFASAAEAEQLRAGTEAVDAYLGLIDSGLAAGEEGLDAVLAGLDALAWRESVGLGRIGPLHALAFRVPGGLERVKGRLGSAYDDKRGTPLARGFVAQAMLDLARFEGDAARAAAWRARTGAAQRASVVGPLSWAPLGGVEQKVPLEDEGALRDGYPGFGPFAGVLRPATIEADDGVLDPAAVNGQPGVYAAIIDAVVPRAGRIYLSLQSTASASLVVGGKLAISRPYTLGGGPVVRLGQADVGAGKLRLVVKIGLNEDGARFGLDVLGEDGAALALSAPEPGEAATAVASAAGPLAGRGPARPSPELDAAALLTLGDARGARRLLEQSATGSAAGPGLSLLFARALGRSDDVPEIRRIERARSAYARALAAWPLSWEATIGDAVYAAARKGPGEGRVESLRDLSKARAERGVDEPLGLSRAFEGATAMEVGMRDVALGAFEEVKAKLAGTPLLAELDARVHPRVGAEAEAFACAAPGVDRQSLACMQQHARRGDSAGVYAELARLRALRGSRSALRANELAQKLTDGDVKGALGLYDALDPGERFLVLLGLSATSLEGETRSRLTRDWLVARDSPGQIGPLLRLLGDDPAPAFEAEGLRAVSADRSASAGSSATLVLLHDERYAIGGGGLLRVTVHDVRRVAGTTDVDQGASSGSYVAVGRDIRRVLRRRIHKKDGRVLEPDRAANAAQGNAYLSQLEPGDYIEQISEGFTLPDRAGHLVIDTPDLLPERTSVRRASIELRHPRGLALARWAHPLLGKPEERDEGDTHVVRYQLRDAAPRRIEEGVPRMDRDVGVSFGTYSWRDVARHLDEEVRSLGDDDPFVARWARAAGGDGAGTDRATVERVVVAAGKAIKVAQGNMLSDTAASLSSGAQQYSARHILELGQGSRTWIIYRALGELRIPAEIVVAEREPFSADPSFPARPSRFDRPLVIAHVPGGDVWIDADVVGPPLPAGRVSPELRGRVALRLSGEMVPVEGAAVEGASDEVDIRLKVDARGDAAGTFTVKLRGRPAQGLADALDRVVGTDRREMLRGVVLGWMPWANVNEVSLSSGEGSWEVSVRAEVAIPSFAQGEGKTWVLPGLEPLHTVFPRAAVSTIGATYATRMGRQNALAVDTAYQYRAHRHIELPAGARVLGAPPQVSVKTDLLEASRQTKLEGATLDEDFTLSLSTGTIGPAQYDAFARQAKRLDDAFLAGTRVAH